MVWFSRMFQNYCFQLISFPIQLSGELGTPISCSMFIQQDLHVVVGVRTLRSSLTLLTRSCEVSDPSSDRCCASLPLSLILPVHYSASQQSVPALLGSNPPPSALLCSLPTLRTAQGSAPRILPSGFLRPPFPPTSNRLSCLRSAKKNSYT